MKIFSTVTSVKMLHDDELINGEDYSNMPSELVRRWLSLNVFYSLARTGYV